MATPPRFTAFRYQDFAGAPEWTNGLLKTLNDVLTATVENMSKRLTRDDNFQAGEKLGASFAAPMLVFKHELPTQPRHVSVTNLSREDGVALSAAWSWSWRITQQGLIELTFQGLTSGNKYIASVTYE